MSQNKPTRGQVSRWNAIRKSQQAKAADAPQQPKGDVVKLPPKFVLQDVAPFDAIIGFTEASRGMTKGDNSRSFTTLKGVQFVVDGVAYTRTCMAYGDASVELNKLLDAGETMLEVQLTPNFNTMKITGLVIDGDFVSFPDERTAPVAEEQAEIRDAA